MTDSGGGAGAPDEDAATPQEPRSDDRTSKRPPQRRAGAADAPPAPTDNPLRWYVQTRNPVVVATRDVLTSVVLVVMVGLTLFAVSGVWPPMVAIESGSMEPHMAKGDLVVVVEEDRFTSQQADANGIVARETAETSGHEQFGNPGSVIVYQPDGQQRTPIIHRVAFPVEEGENWISKAEPEYLAGVDSCEEVPRNNCPAPHDGYVTRGDANRAYDQIEGQSTVVHPSWINGRAVARAPYLGCIRLELSEGPQCFEDRRSAGA